jgi:hypothetical protein
MIAVEPALALTSATCSSITQYRNKGVYYSKTYEGEKEKGLQGKVEARQGLACEGDQLRLWTDPLNHGCSLEVFHMRRLFLVAVVVSGLGLGASVATEAGGPKPYDAGPSAPYGAPAPSFPPDCHALDPPCPPALPVEELTSELSFADQLVMTPPPSDVVPSMTPEAAADYAWAQDGGGSGAAAQKPLLALLPAGGNFPVDILVWVIQYTGIDCVMSSAPLGGSPSCNHTWTTVIDANTGEFIYAYTDA